MNVVAVFCAVFLDFISAAMFARPAGDSSPDSLAAHMMRCSVEAVFKLAGVGVMRRLRYSLRMCNPGLGVKECLVVERSRRSVGWGKLRMSAPVSLKSFSILAPFLLLTLFLILYTNNFLYLLNPSQTR